MSKSLKNWFFALAILAFPVTVLGQNGTKGFVGEKASTKPMGRSLALIVGISDYANIESLQFADRDAQIFEQLLLSQKGGGIPSTNIKSLYNSEATHYKIYEGLDWLADNVEAEDRVYVYFSGHGDVESMFNKPKGYLLSYDTPSQSYRAGAVRMTDVTEFITAMSEIGAEVIFIADACRSGNLIGGKEGASAVITHLEQPWGNVIKMLSCGQDELSLESSKIGGGRGLFSYHLIEGMAGEAESTGDGRINLYELSSYVKEKVIAGASPSSQFPRFFGEEKTIITEFDKSSLALWKAQTSTSELSLAMANTRGNLGETISDLDGEWQKKIAVFESSLATQDVDNQILETLFADYRSFVAEHPKHRFGAVMKRKLISDIIAESQQVINQYVNGEFEYMADFKQLFKPVNVKLDSCLTLLDTTDALYQEVRSKVLFTKVIAHNYANDNEAINALQEAVRIDPMASYVYHLLGKYLNKMNNRSASIEAFETAIKLSPKWFYPYNNLGLVYQGSGRLDMAIENYLTASTLNPSDPSAFNNLGSAYLAKQDYPNSIQGFKKAIELAPDNDAYWFRSGEALRESGEDKLAVDSYKKALELNPKDDLIYDRLAFMHLKNDNDQEALKAMLKALELDPDNQYYCYNLACFHTRTGDTQKGMQFIEMALEQGWNDKSHMMSDPELEDIRKLDSFKKLLEKHFPD